MSAYLFRTCGVCLVLSLGLMTRPARANNSSFRLIGAQKTSSGCTVTVRYNNRWMDVIKGNNNRIVKLTAWGQFGKSAFLGSYSMVDAGSLYVDVDYRSCGFAAGESITFSGHWPGGHTWGGSERGKEAGWVVLP